MHAPRRREEKSFCEETPLIAETLIGVGWASWSKEVGSLSLMFPLPLAGKLTWLL